MKANKSILFVENDATVLTTYGKLLQREGFRVENAQDGLDALKALSQLRHDLVVLELMLPTFNGAEVLKFIRADPRLKTVPVIVFTDASAAELLQDATLASGTKYLPKSDCTPPVLLQTIQEMLAATPDSDAAEGGDAAPAEETAPSKEQSDFLKDAPAEIAKVREHCLAFLKAPTSAPKLQALSQCVNALGTNADKAGCGRIVPLTKAFETLLARITAKPSLATPSILQTIAEAADCLGLLKKGAEAATSEPPPKAKVLAVDDDTVCNQVMVSTLKRANFDISSVEDPLEGLRMMEANRYDLILLDIDMPKLTGFEVCEKLRRLPHYKTTPVIFVTAHSNFENRTKGVLSGGNYFIAKPIDPSELALKVTIHLFKAQMQQLARAEPKPEARSRANATPEAAPAPAAPIPANPSENGKAKTAEPPPSAAPPVTKPRAAAAPAALPPLAAPLQINPAKNGNGKGRTSEPPSAAPSLSAAPPINAPPAVKPRATNISKVLPPLSSAQNLAETGTLNVNMLSGNRNRNRIMMNKEQDEAFDKIVIAVVRIIFGDDNLTDMNVRLVRIALERYNVQEVINSSVAA